MSAHSAWRARLAAVTALLTTPEVRRAFRATAAYMTPILVIYLTAPAHALDASFAALCAHNISLTDLRGAYWKRFCILFFSSLVLATSGALGAAASTNALTAVVGMGVVALLATCWRHFSPDYGPSLAVGSMLVFLIALSVQPDPTTLADTSVVTLRFVFALGGALTGTFFQIILWPIKPQYPLRHAVADSWTQLALVCEAMAPQDDTLVSSEKIQNIGQAEANLNEVLNKNVIALDGTGSRQSDLIKKLDAVNLGVVRLATHVEAFHTAFEPVLEMPEAARLVPSAESLLVAIANMSRSIATTVVTRRAEHFGLSWLRFQRVANLAKVLRERLTNELGGTHENARLITLVLQNLEAQLPRIEKDLRVTVEDLPDDHTFPRLPDIGIHSLKPLTAGFNFTWPPDPFIVRYGFRVATLTMAAVAVYKGFAISHGYWIAMTMMVVLQPNYGPTRQRAMQRMLGTIAGGVVGSIFAWIHPPLWAVHSLMAVAAFGFAVNQKQRYTIAVFFVTLLVVLSTESMSTVDLALTQSRIACTVAGGFCAMLAALAFWPNWERERFPGLLAKTMRANRDYLLLIASRFTTGSALDEGITHAKQRAETAGSELFTSLQRLSSDPRRRRGNLNSSGALMSSTLRITRALTVLSLHLRAGMPLREDAFERTIRELARAMETTIRAENGESVCRFSEENVRQALREFESSAKNNAASTHEAFVHAQLEKILTEIETLWVVLREPD